MSVYAQLLKTGHEQEPEPDILYLPSVLKLLMSCLTLYVTHAPRRVLRKEVHLYFYKPISKELSSTIYISNTYTTITKQICQLYSKINLLFYCCFFVLTLMLCLPCNINLFHNTIHSESYYCQLYFYFLKIYFQCSLKILMSRFQ